jgi:hypothetical protein
LCLIVLAYVACLIPPFWDCRQRKMEEGNPVGLISATARL